MKPAVLASECVPINLAVSSEADAFIEQLARTIGVTKEEVFSRALALLAVAVEAKQDGNQLAVTDSEGKLVSAITGLWTEGR